MQKEKRNKICTIIGILLIVIGIVFWIIPFYNNKVEDKKEDNLINEYIDSTEQEITVIEPETVPEETKTVETIKYSMVIEIPKIGLKKGIYGLDSRYNSISYGIQVLKESNMPDIEKGNLILASHRGNSSVSHFNNLYKLENGDRVYIYYNGIKYVYELVNKYDEVKDGTIVVHRNNEDTVLTLITCKKNEEKQTVFINRLIEKENY